METREVKDTDHEGDRSGIVIEDVDTEMENNNALTVDTQKSKDWPINRDLPEQAKPPDEQYFQQERRSGFARQLRRQRSGTYAQDLEARTLINSR